MSAATLTVTVRVTEGDALTVDELAALLRTVEATAGRAVEVADMAVTR